MILVIGIELIPVGIKYAAGGAADFQINNPAWGDFSRWGLALVVIIVALIMKFMTTGILSSAANLIGPIAGYIIAIIMG